MVEKVLLIAVLTMIIHATETLSYAVRLAGVRVGRLAVALTLTGMIVLISRTSNLIQGPLTGNLIDGARASAADLEFYFRYIIAASSVGTLFAMILFPTAVRLASRMIAHLEVAGSVPQLIRTSVSLEKIRRVKYHIKAPRWEMLSRLRVGGIPKRLLIMNALVTGVYTIGVLSALYASFLYPEYAAAASQSSGLINGVATIILTILIDPQVALLTDRTLRGEAHLSEMNKTFGFLMLSRFCGTLLAQLLFIPAVTWIGWVVSHL